MDTESLSTLFFSLFTLRTVLLHVLVDSYIHS